MKNWLTCLDSQNDPSFCLTRNQLCSLPIFPFDNLLLRFFPGELFFPSLQNIVMSIWSLSKKLHIKQRECGSTVSIIGKEINSIATKVWVVFTTETSGWTERHRMQSPFSIPAGRDNRFPNNAISTNKFRHNNHPFLRKDYISFIF